MTTMNEVFLYLNKYDPSKIRPLVDPVVADMKNMANSEAQLDGKIRDALEKSRYPFIPLEYGEIKLHSAVAKYSHKKHIESKILMDEAVAKFENDPHRRAFTLWMMGINAMAMEDVSFAYNYWMSARIILDDIIKGRRFTITKPETTRWYQERLKELNFNMASSCIQEIYHWFGAYDTSNLDGQTLAFSEKIFEAIGFRKTHEAHQLIDCLIRLAEMGNDHDQLRDVFVLCGVAKYLLGATPDSVKYFSEAIIKLEPKSQRQAVAYWLKGIAQWRIPQLREEAVTNLMRAIDLFKDLRLKADKKHIVPMLNWYDEKLSFMENELSKKEKTLLNI
jgi:tetratricopeptide (TPR) repeat protein